jgi:hypothetical protein
MLGSDTNMILRRAVLWLLTVALLSATPACRGGRTARDAESDRRALAAAAIGYVRQNSVPGLEFELAVEIVDGDYARLRAEAPNLTPIRVFMKRVNGSWIGMEMGSGIDPEDLAREGFPARMR